MAYIKYPQRKKDNGSEDYEIRSNSFILDLKEENFTILGRKKVRRSVDCKFLEWMILLVISRSLTCQGMSFTMKHTGKV